MLSSKRKSNEKQPVRSTRPRVDTNNSTVKKPIKSNENAKAPQQRPNWDHRVFLRMVTFLYGLLTQY